MHNALVVTLGALAVVGGAGCGGVLQRFPDDVQASLAHTAMRRLETDRFIIYYPAHRRALVDRFLVRAQSCAAALRDAAVIHDGPWNDKMVIAMPEAAFNNAFVMSDLAGYEHVSVIPTTTTLDLATEFGLPPDPGLIACHELTHYVQFEQVSGFWERIDTLFGHLYTPQVGYDPWFLEGLATHYEAKLSAGVGRPRWPVFTAMFAAAYAGRHVGSGELSHYGRRASVGHHYLVGTMFVRFLTERYGERGLWLAIASEARALTGLLFPGTFRDGFGVSFSELLDEFDRWCAQTFPVRGRPAGQRTLAVLGSDARYARGRDGTEAWVASDVDVPPGLIVRAPDGRVVADLGLVDIAPPRTLVQAAPLLVSGLSVTADGTEVWLTMIDLGATYQVPRLLRWRRDSGLTEVSHELGPGATIDPTGATYYYCDVDGDRWSLAAWDVRTGVRRPLVDMRPGSYVLGAQVSPDGKRLVANVWDGSAFVVWVIDAATGARLAEQRAPGPLWDASFTDDGRVMALGEVDGRFQILIDGRAVSDAPYAVLAARSTRGTIRFLNRDGWGWTLDEIAAPAPPAPAAPADVPPPVGAAAPADPALADPPPPANAASPDVAPPAATAPAAAAAVPPATAPAAAAAVPPATAPAAATGAPSMAPAVTSDEPYSPWEHFFFPQLRAPTVIAFSAGVPHVGAVLGGGDRLGMQRWSAAGYVQLGSKIDERLHWGGDAEYLNTMLAPWRIIATGSYVDWVDPVATGNPDVMPAVVLAEQRRTRDASLSLSRTVRETLTLAVAGVYTDDYDEPPGTLGVRRHLGGPSLTLAWESVESTPYAGARRALLFDAAAAYYPHALSSFAGDIRDVAGAVGAVMPLPLGRRHTITARLRGRALLARDDTGLLQLGGVSALATLVSARSVSREPPGFDTQRFPPGLRFVELVRGYEDHAIATDRAAIADLSWRYPLIIDRGVAATFRYLPASFVRQLDIELFASAALDQREDLHAAAGAALSLRIVALRVPLLIAYQVARRVRDDEALTQLLGLGIGL